MAANESQFRFIIISGIVWLTFGVIGLIDTPVRVALTIAQFVAAAVHFIYGFLLWRRS
jgi:hypothetical protein